MEQIIPFYIPPGAVGVGAVVEIEPTMETGRTLELVVVEGGPVFMFKGRRTAEEAYRATHNSDAIDFDLAASATSKSARGVEQRYGNCTLHSDNETIGYVRVTDRKE